MSFTVQKIGVPYAGESTKPASKVIERNVRTNIYLRTRAAGERSLQSRIADAITSFSGRMAFVYVHLVGFGLQAFDPFLYGLLTMIVSLEAIFLSTLVLISPNRIAKRLNGAPALICILD